MTLTSRELTFVVDAMRGQVEGARVQKIYQTADHTLSIQLHGSDLDAWLIVTCEPGLAHIALADERVAHDPTPPRFCATARKHLEGGRVVELAVVPGDRVATLTVERADGVRTLVAELFGRHGNLIVIDGEGRVLDAARAGSGPRPCVPGDVYQPPHAVAPPAQGPAAQRTVRDFGEGDIAFAIGRFYARERDRSRRDRARAELLAAVRKSAKRAREHLAKLTREAEDAGDPVRLRADAEHLAASMHLVKKGLDRIEIEDWYGGPARVIVLDPKLGAAGQVDRLFTRARRGERKLAALAEQIPEAKRRADLAAALAQEIERAPDDALGVLRARAEAENFIPKPRNPIGVTAATTRKSTPQLSGPRRYVAKDGSLIVVGRDARENDEVTFRIGVGNDWWFHVSGESGSHVVVKVPPGQELSSETLLDAATLALRGSRLVKQGAGEVRYTQRKYVRKPKGAPPGRVVVEQTKTVFVRVDENRVKRLEESRR
ncbi:MAG: NFACT family protein [Deltaproteobacteria bacterium]|nr:NFACT family protein [Deltaproteobacteria bacterium]